MRPPNLLNSEQAALLIVDVQEKFRAHIHDFDSMVKNIVRLVDAFKILNVPIFVTEQYPKGLGKTVLEIQKSLTVHNTFEKTAFSCLGSSEFLNALGNAKRTQILVCGIEAHVCVNQTVHDLLAKEFKVHIVEDAISSRDLSNKEIALRRMALSGAVPSSTEMALLELVKDSASDSFKAVQALIR